MNQEQLYLENHTTHEDGTYTVTLVRTCSFQWYKYCLPISLLWVSTAIKYVNPLSDHWWSNSIFGNTPQHPRLLQWRISGVQQQSLAALQQCRNLAESCFRKRTGSRVRKYINLTDYRIFRTVTLIAPSASGDWRSSSIFQSPDTVDSAFLFVA